jgi:hypothetical protein
MGGLVDLSIRTSEQSVFSMSEPANLRRFLLRNAQQLSGNTNTVHLCKE